MSKNHRRLKCGDNFVNTTNILKMIFVKLSLKPQNDNGFQKNHCRFPSLYLHRVTFPFHPIVGALDQLFPPSPRALGLHHPLSVVASLTHSLVLLHSPEHQVQISRTLLLVTRIKPTLRFTLNLTHTHTATRTKEKKEFIPFFEIEALGLGFF